MDINQYDAEIRN